MTKELETQRDELARDYADGILGIDDAVCYGFNACHSIMSKREAALVRIIKEAELHHHSPCCLCDYFGPGYFQPETHECMRAAHAGEKEA